MPEASTEELPSESTRSMQTRSAPDIFGGRVAPVAGGSWIRSRGVKSESSSFDMTMISELEELDEICIDQEGTKNSDRSKKTKDMAGENEWL